MLDLSGYISKERKQLLLEIYNVVISLVLCPLLSMFLYHLKHIEIRKISFSCFSGVKT